jgi:pimeloyl-ACP methyl ester carboxylesterase
MVVTVGASALALAGVVPLWSGLVHAVALPPLDLALDLRLLVARAPSYSFFLAGAGVSLVLRSAVLGTLLFSAGLLPSFGQALARAAKLYAAVLIPLAVAGALEFAGLAAVYALYAWVGLALTALLVVLVAPRTLAARGARFRRIPIVLGYLVALMVIGGLARLTEPWGTVPAVLASAGLTAFTLLRLAEPPANRPVTPAGALALLLVLLPGGLPRAQVGIDAALLVVPGVDTSTGRGAAYRLDPSHLGFPCDRVYYFSYRGPDESAAPQGEAACPIRLHRTYFPPATQRPLGELVEALAAQVAAVRTQIGASPLVVLTHSQGAAIAWRAAVDGRVDGISHLIGLGGFPHSPVGYPPPWRNGPGRVGADTLRVLSWVTRFMGFGSFEPDASLPREILAHPDGLESVFDDPLPDGVTGALVFTSWDVAVAPEGHEIPSVPTFVVDTTHVGVTTSLEAEVAVRAVLAGRPPSGTSSIFGWLLDGLIPPFLPPPADD